MNNNKYTFITGLVHDELDPQHYPNYLVRGLSIRSIFRLGQTKVRTRVHVTLFLRLLQITYVCCNNTSETFLMYNLEILDSYIAKSLTIISHINTATH